MSSDRRQLEIVDYDGDKIVIDCRMPNRFYIEAFNPPEEPVVETCISLDKKAAQEIVRLLENWLNDGASDISPNIITYK